jgi:hypothetical protein
MHHRRATLRTSGVQTASGIKRLTGFLIHADIKPAFWSVGPFVPAVDIDWLRYAMHTRSRNRMGWIAQLPNTNTLTIYCVVLFRVTTRIA